MQGYSRSFAHTGGEAARGLYPQGFPQGYSRSFTQVPTHVPTHNNDNNDNDNKSNRTLKAGPSFCGKTHLLLKKIKLIRLEDPQKQIFIITRSQEQYEDIDIGEASHGIEVEKNVGDLEEYRGCCVVFDDMLDSNQKLIHPFFTRGRQSCVMFIIYVRVILMRQKRQLETFKGTYHSGFDMSYEEFKSLCREAWNEKFNSLLINRLEDKSGSRYMICNESNPNYKIFNPRTDPSNN